MAPYYKTFVSLGNAKQHYLRLLNAVRLHIHSLPQPILIQRGHTPFEFEQCDVVDFINMDEFVEHVAYANVLIMHAGAGSVLHTVKAGKRPIVMPRRCNLGEIVNDHQVDFAKTLHSAGKVLMVENEYELSEAIKLAQTNVSEYQFTNNTPKALNIIKSKIDKILCE